MLINLIIAVSILMPAICLANNVDKITCTELGLIPNDESKGRSNLGILTDALQNDTKILVDNKYYLTGSGVPAKIKNDIVIEGITNNAELSFTENTISQSNFLDVESANLSMSGIKFTSKQNAVAFRFFDTYKIDTLVVKNCYFEGPIRLINWEFTDNIYPNPDQYGIGKLVFEGNECKNIGTAFIVVHNVPINHSQIISNTINNFSHIFYSQEITNNNSYGNQLAKSMNLLEVKDNTVVNDIAWDGMPTTQMYHCFIFFEGNKCNYIRNRVEGLHVFDQDTVVYDAYLSCIDLNYEGNYWKNNITFNSNYARGRQLLKCKYALEDDYKNIKRVYKNNTFIVENSYADVMKRPREELWVVLGELELDIDSFIIENNTIDVHILRFGSVDMFAHNFIFNNNKIHADTVDGDRNNCVLPVAIKNTFGSPCSYVARNNEITIDNPRTASTRNNSLIRIGVLEQDCLEDIQIIFENNLVNWPDLDALVSTVYSTGDKTINMQINQNIIMTGNTPRLTIGNQSISSLIIDFNTNDSGDRKLQ